MTSLLYHNLILFIFLSKIFCVISTFTYLLLLNYLLILFIYLLLSKLQQQPNQINPNQELDILLFPDISNIDY